jgi:hypothetical protein
MRSAAHDYNRLEAWVARLSGSARLRVIPKRTAEFTTERLATVRADIEKLESQLQQVEAAPLDRESQKAEQAQLLDAVVMTCYWDKTQFGRKLCTRTPNLRELTNIEYDWWRHPEQRNELLEMLVPEVPGAMSAAEKAAALERLGARRLSALRAEEGIIMTAEQTGIFIVRRHAADESVLLGAAIVRDEQVEAAAA